MPLQEKRRIKRHHLPYYLQVHNRSTGRPLGYLVNVSYQGMMLVSRVPVLTHALFKLQIKLPAPLMDSRKIDFDAFSHWCKVDVTPGCYNTGFSFSDPPKALNTLVDSLTDFFKFDWVDEE